MTGSQLTTRKQALSNVEGLLNQYALNFQRALPEAIGHERLLEAAVNACRKTPKLMDCTRVSLLGSLLASAQMGLLPDGRQAALVPFKDQATLIPMYQGLTQVAYRSGLVVSINSAVIFNGDNFFWRGKHQWPDHDPAWLNEEEPGEPRGAWAGLGIKGGGVHVEILSKEAIEKIKKRSRGAGKPDSPWNHSDDWEWMWRKTVLRAALKEGPQSYDLATALTLDDQATSGQPQDLPQVRVVSQEEDTGSEAAGASVGADRPEGSREPPEEPALDLVDQDLISGLQQADSVELVEAWMVSRREKGSVPLAVTEAYEMAKERLK